MLTETVCVIYCNFSLDLDTKQWRTPLESTAFLVMYIFSHCLWFFKLFIIFTFTYICVHVSVLPTLPPHPQPLTSRQNLFSPLLRFCWENIRDNKKDLLFLLVWDKDSYTERFLALLPWTCVLKPTLVHFYLTSLLLPGPLPIVANFIHSSTVEHIDRIQVLHFLSFPYFSHAYSLLSVWPMSNNITAFVLGL
jgi:hypothetical protein